MSDERNLAQRGRHGRDWGTIDDDGKWTPFDAPPRDWTEFATWAAAVAGVVLIGLAVWAWL